MLPYS
jgi:hypothetical protein